MKTHLRNASKQGFRAVLSTTSPADRCTWVLQNLNQVALLGVNLKWTVDVLSALSVADSATARQSQCTPRAIVTTRLSLVLDDSISFIQYISQRMSRQISSLHRQALMSVMITVVHHRDAVSCLQSSRVTSSLDFVWQSQLRCISCHQLV